MKKILLFLISIGFLMSCNTASAAINQKSVPITPSASPIASPIQPQVVDVENCNKIFKTGSQKLFYLTLASINANRFTIDEIQSKTGYIIFSVGQTRQIQFLASVITINNQASLLKITPCNNNYFFPIGIMQNMFKYIELNINTPITKLAVQ